MKRWHSDDGGAPWLSWLVVIIIALLPIHAFLTVWLGSLVGHYTLLRLWKEMLLAVLIGGCIYLIIKHADIRKKVLSSWTAKLIIAYGLLSALLGLVAYGLGNVTLKALGYGLVVNLRFLVFFLAVWIVALKSPLLRTVWPKLLLIPAAIVVAVGLLQRLILPYDFLKHFGYGPNTILPYQTINYDINYTRIMSTLRGANPLGAYLILILGFASVFLAKARKNRRLWVAFGLAAILALLFSYSRSAWIGMTISAVWLAWLLQRSAYVKKLLAASLLALVVLAVLSLLAFRNNTTFQNYFFHTSDRSSVKVSSNEERLSAFKSGLTDVVNEPLGRGVGTAGPGSIYNDNKGRISENYFIQIAQEIGWFGLVLFLAINFLVIRELWLRRSESLAVILLVSFAGLTFVNLVSHAWADDTLAYIWWGLAGIALASPKPIAGRM